MRVLTILASPVTTGQSARESFCSTAGVIICGRIDEAVGVQIDPYCQRRGTNRTRV